MSKFYDGQKLLEPVNEGIVSGTVDLWTKFRNFVRYSNSSLNVRSNMSEEQLNKLLLDEQTYLKLLRKYGNLVDERRSEMNFDEMDTKEEDRHFRIVWAFIHTENVDHVEAEKALTQRLVDKIKATNSRHLGTGSQKNPVFLSQAWTITTIEKGSDKLTVVWPDARTIVREITNSEIRIKTAKAALANKMKAKSDG
jgi:hypothetical protein